MSRNTQKMMGEIAALKRTMKLMGASMLAISTLTDAELDEFIADKKLPWGAAAGGGTTPEPGGLDRLGVVKELRELAAIFGWAWDASRLMTGPVSLKVNRNLEAAVPRLQQLISKLDGHGAEKPAASEPEGQCGEAENVEKERRRCQCYCACKRMHSEYTETDGRCHYCRHSNHDWP